MNKLILLNARAIFVLGILFFTTACNDNSEEDYVIINVTPSDTFIFEEVSSTDTIVFNVTARSTKPNLNRLKITYNKEDQASINTLYDEEISGLNFDLRIAFPFTITESELYYFQFEAQNADGLSAKHLKRVRLSLDTTERILEAKDGFRLYPAYAGEIEDGFNISLEDNVIASDTVNTDSSLVDIYEVPSSTLGVLSKKWRTLNNGRFVKTNRDAFDYPNATEKSFEQAYAAGDKKIEVIDLKKDDILLFKSSNANYFGAILIRDVIDLDSGINDYYEFDLKK